MVLEIKKHFEGGGKGCEKEKEEGGEGYKGEWSGGGRTGVGRGGG